jgi:uncharacterized repeat protein (TIGR03803 family)
MRRPVESGTIGTLCTACPSEARAPESSTAMSFPNPAFLYRAQLVAPVVMAFALALPGVAAAEPAVSTIVAFSGSAANGSPVLADGALYGTTSVVTTVTGGLVYRAAADGSSIRTIYQLRLTDGTNPQSGLLLASDGKLYGTTLFGDASQLATTGTVFRVAPDGTGFEVVHRFRQYTTVNVIGSPVNADGSNPEAELIEEAVGAESQERWLYGVTRAGGAAGTGVVFRMKRDGSTVEVLHQFEPIATASNVSPIKNPDGYSPSGALVELDGYLYGTTSAGARNGNGTLFRVSKDGSDFDTLFEFPATTASTTTPPTNADGATPLAGLTLGTDGLLYGVASAGGTAGAGTVFVYDPALYTEPVDGAEPGIAAFRAVHSFDGNNGARPLGELRVGLDGRLYGTTATGGTGSGGTLTNLGTMFVVERSGDAYTFTRLHAFDGSNDGSAPAGRLLQLDASTFVGVTQAGGRCGQGTLYQYSTTGAEVDGIRNCGRNNDSGGGSTTPALLLLLVGAALVRLRRHA